MCEFNAGDTVTIRLTKVMSERLNRGLNVIYDQPDIMKHKKAEFVKSYVNVYKNTMCLLSRLAQANRSADSDRLCCIELSVNVDTKDVTARVVS